jgi:hypothetical protein
LRAQEASRQEARYRVRTYHAFEELPADYHRLLQDMAKVNFSLSLPWFLAFTRTALQEGASVRLYGVESGEHEVRAHALFVAQTPAARRGSVLVDRHIGCRTLSGLTGYQTYLYAPLLRDDEPDYDGILTCLARHLRDERPRWNFIEFSAMDGEARSYGALMKAFRKAGYTVRSYPHFLGMFETTRGQNYAAYLSARSSSDRKQIKNYERKERKLRERSILRSELFTSEAALDRALKDFAAVLDASWKDPDHHPAFLPACIRAAAQAGALRLAILYLEEAPAAIQLVFLAGRRAVFYRTAYDPAFARESVGAVVKLGMIRHLLDNERDVDEFDFGRDRETFKKTWASQERTRCGILAFDCRTPGGLRGLAEQLAFELRDWLGEISRPLRARLDARRRGGTSVQDGR